MKWAIAAVLLLVASLGLKANGQYAVPTDDYGPALDQVAEGLKSNGFVAQADSTKRQVLAQRDGCQVDARLLDPHATVLRHLERRLAGNGPIRFAWRGQWHDGLPRLRALFQYYAVRELARQGIGARRDPVWLVSTSARCRLPDPATFAVPVTLSVQP